MIKFSSCKITGLFYGNQPILRRIILALLLSFLLLSASGCWDYLEYENMAQVDAMATDFDNTTKKVTVTVEYLQIGKGGGGKDDKSKPQAVLRSATDWTPSGAARKIQQGIGKRIFFGYLRVLIYSEDAAKYIMKDMMQVNDRAPDIRETANLVITSGKAEDALSTMDPDVPMPPGRMISDMLATTRGTGAAFPVSLQDFNEMLAIGGVEAVAPRVNTAVIPPAPGDQKSAGKSGAGVTGSSGSSGSKSSGPKSSGSAASTGEVIRGPKPKEGHHWIEGMAVFKADRMVGWLNRQESMGWGWLTGKNIRNFKIINNSAISFTKKMMIFQIIKSGSKIKPRLDQGRPIVEVNVKVEAYLRKYLSGLGMNYLRPDLIKSLEKALAAGVAADIRVALRKGQKDLKSDIFGFGFAFYRKYPYLWHSRYGKEWPRIFPDIPVRFKVRAKVTNTGTNVRQFIIK